MKSIPAINKTFLVSAVFLFIAGITHAKPEYEIKFATVAPDGSTWMKVMREMDNEVREKTDGEVGFKIYPGGVHGDEPDVIRKIRYGQLHSAGFTGAGLGEILPEVRVLELPFLFRSKEEVDYITDMFYDRFDASFRRQGFVLLGWTEVGYIYIYSNSPIRGLDDFRGLKVWTWEGDPLARALFDEIGVTPLPLSLTEVLTGLQTGMLDAVYCSPLAVISLQWFTRVEYMNLLPLTNATGAVLMTSKQFDKIPPDKQEILLEVCRRHLRRLTELSRRDNASSIEQLEINGITLIERPGDEEMPDYLQIGERIQDQLADYLYSRQLLEEILGALEEYRNR